jgi:hypothetical protein
LPVETSAPNSDPAYGETGRGPLTKADGRGSESDVRITDIYCPECGEAAEDMSPTDWRVPGEVPGYRHVADRTTLCPVLTRDGDRPAEPTERADLDDEAGA